MHLIVLGLSVLLHHILLIMPPNLG